MTADASLNSVRIRTPVGWQGSSKDSRPLCRCAAGTEPCLKVRPRLADSHEGMFLKRVCVLLLACIAVVPGGATFSRASLLRAMSLAELAQASDRVVVGNVVGVNAAWDLQHRKIISTIEVDVDETWKGQAGVNRRIAIVQPGGSVGDIEMTVHGMPSFSVGERALLFLQGHGRFQVVGMSQGKRSLAWDDVDKRWLVESPETEGVIDVGSRVSLRQAKRQDPIPIGDLRDQVRRAIGNSP